MWWWCGFTKWENIQVKRSKFSSARNGRGEKRHNLRNHTCALQDTAVSFLGRNGWEWADLLATILCCSWEYRMCNETSGWGWCQNALGQAASPHLTVVLHSHILPLSPCNVNEKLLNMKGLFFLCRIHGFICQDNKITFCNNIWHEFFRVEWSFTIYFKNL